MRNWKALIDSSSVGKPRLCSPATAAQLHDLEDELQVTLPAELRSLLAQTNGVHCAPDTSRALETDCGRGLSWVLDVADILRYNLEVRDDRSAYRYMEPDDETDEQPVDDFLFFSNIAGNGDLYAICLFPVDGFRPSEIIHWDHALNERTRVASSLSAWIESWDALPGSALRKAAVQGADLALVDA